MSIIFIQTNGTITQPSNEDRERMTTLPNNLEWLQEAVAGRNQERGWIEIVQMTAWYSFEHRMQMIVNEEGLLLQEPINAIGTLFYTALCRGKNETPICGNIVILTNEDCLD